MTGTVLILGATGRFGRHAAQAFAAAGWQVRLFRRGKDDLARAARGAEVIVNAWNPPYPDWARQVPVLHDKVIRVARQTGATVLLPGNVYVFGPDAPGPWGATTPYLARNPLGRIRIAMESAYRASGVRTIVLRAGDFIDTEASGNWFDQVMIRALHKGQFRYPGDPEVDHAWAWLPDLARAAVALADRRDGLPDFADIPFAGYTLSGRAMAGLIGDALDRPVRAQKMPWWPVQLARPVWPMARHLIEMRYLWSLPHRLDGRDLDRLVPDLEYTPAGQALARALPLLSVAQKIDPDQPVAAGG